MKDFKDYTVQEMQEEFVSILQEQIDDMPTIIKVRDGLKKIGDKIEAEKLKIIKCNTDDYASTRVVMMALDCNQQKAVTTLMEIGLANILSYPCGNKKVDALLSEPKYQKMIEELRKIWTL